MIIELDESDHAHLSSVVAHEVRYYTVFKGHHQKWLDEATDECTRERKRKDLAENNANLDAFLQLKAKLEKCVMG